MNKCVSVQKSIKTTLEMEQVHQLALLERAPAGASKHPLAPKYPPLTSPRLPSETFLHTVQTSLRPSHSGYKYLSHSFFFISDV